MYDVQGVIHKMSLAVEKKFEYSSLSHHEAKKRLREYGLNAIRTKKKKSALIILLEQFSDFMVIVLLVATAISAFMGEIVEAVTIAAIVVINSFLGFIQEYRTERALEALKQLAAPRARVVRDGEIFLIPAEEVVPGDVIVLEEGDRVSADATLVEAISLSVDESLLTGESFPVEKKADNSVFMGTVVTRGRGRAIAFATGMNTEMGRIADMIQNVGDEKTPLQKRLDTLGRYIVTGCLLICAVVSLTGILRGEDIFNMMLAGISLAVAAVPEGLPAVVTISLAVGVQRMAKRSAVVRRLPAVETLGCIDVICSDKTGTLTENKMTVRKIYAGGSLIDIEKGSIGNVKTSAPRLLLKTVALCNDARISTLRKRSILAGRRQRGKRAGIREVEIIGDPTEAALLDVAVASGIWQEINDEGYQRVDEIPFDSARKCMSVICVNKKGERYVFCKGAPDVLINKCSHVFFPTGRISLTPDIKAKIMLVNDRMAGEALRVLGAAYKKVENGNMSLKEAENNLVFIGLVGMIDPPREEARTAVQKCMMAGIRPVMITGDHRNTACAIARELGMYTPGQQVLTGSDIEKIGEEGLLEAVEKTQVYARVAPVHKLMIVRSLKKLGHTVAMTGDGVNDAPAVKEADIGIAMGKGGTDVTREASSMILMDDNFATIVAAVEEGRAIYSNIRKFIRYLLSCNIGEVLTMFLGMLAGLPVPLLPIQILWVNLVTDGLPAIALGMEPAERGIMTRAPRKSKEGVFSDGLALLIIIRGTLIGASTLAVFASIHRLTGDTVLARTAAFVSLIIMQLVHVFECKSERDSIFEIPFFNNIYLVLAVICSAVMMLAVVYVPLLQKLFRTVPLGVSEWSLIAGFSLLGPIIASFFRRKKSKKLKRR